MPQKKMEESETVQSLVPDQPEAAADSEVPTDVPEENLPPVEDIYPEPSSSAAEEDAPKPKAKRSTRKKPKKQSQKRRRKLQEAKLMKRRRRKSSQRPARRICLNLLSGDAAQQGPHRF